MKEDLSFFRENIQTNELLLEKIGVVSDKTKILLSQLIKSGVGKVTGAGGKKEYSGYILFCTDDIKKSIKILEAEHVVYMPFVPSYTGLTKEV